MLVTTMKFYSHYSYPHLLECELSEEELSEPKTGGNKENP